MTGKKEFVLVLCLFCWPVLASAQYVAVSGGGVFSQDLSAAAPPGVIAGPPRSDFSNGGIVSVDAGIGFLPFLGGGIHYSFSRPELFLRRGDAFGSSALVNLSSHTLTFDTRLHGPGAVGFRPYVLLGGGFTRFLLDVERQVEIPFPGGAPEDVMSPVLTFGGGIEQSLFPLLRWKLEARDYVTPISSSFYRPGGAWHRVVVVAGIVLGR